MLGRNLLRQWLLRPSTSRKVIEDRHDTVSCFADAGNIPIAESVHKDIGGLKGAPLALTRLRKGKATLQNWRAIVQVSEFNSSLYHFLLLHELDYLNV